jgi:hypothetical protein
MYVADHQAVCSFLNKNKNIEDSHTPNQGNMNKWTKPQTEHVRDNSTIPTKETRENENRKAEQCNSHVN